MSKIAKISLTTLPTEILTILIRKLDTESVCKLYDSCIYFKDLICMPGIVRACHFSLNRLATIKSFNRPFFRDVSEHLKILNLCGVNDLNKSSLISVLKNLKSLTNLDVTFTKITMPDYHELAELTPELKSLAINFSFGTNYKVDKKLMSSYQEAFAGLKNVHFVGSSTHLTDGKLAVCILQKADLINLKFTICDNNTVDENLEYEECDQIEMIKMSQFQIYYMHEVFESPLRKSAVFKLMDLNKYEAMLLQSCFRSVCATEMLEEFICKHFDVYVNSLRYAEGMVGQAFILFWDKERMQFDGEFYAKLLVILQENLVHKFEFIETIPVPKYYKLYNVEQYSPGYNSDDSFDDLMAKRARLIGKTFSLNYDAAFKEKKDNFKLKISFTVHSRPVSLHHCAFLRKISHLVLSGDVQLSSAFFKNLFQSCDSLVTLEIIRQRGIVATPLTFLSKSGTIKNIHLHIRGTHLVPIYSCLSKCKTLENISLYNTTLDRDAIEPLPSPVELFSKCDRLYHFAIRSFMQEHDRERQLEYYKSVRTRLGKDWLHVDIIRYFDNPFEDVHNPYTSVFDAFRMQTPI